MTEPTKIDNDGVQVNDDPVAVEQAPPPENRVNDKAAEIRRQVEARVVAEVAMLPPPPPGGAQVDSAFIDQCLFANELGDGSLYNALYRDRFLFCKNTQEWYEWAGHYWRLDTMNHTLSAVEGVVEQYLIERKKASARLSEILMAGDADPDVTKKLRAKETNILKRVSQLRADKRRTACLKFAHTINPPLAISGEEFDDRPMLFPCANGVLDLETGRLHPGRPSDYLTMASPIPFLGIDTPAHLWERTLLQIFNADRPDADLSLVQYFQRLLGYCMTGRVDEKVFAILYGKTGWNGRSLIMEIINYIMGAMAGSIPSEMLLSKKYAGNSSGPSPDIMSLKGLRLAIGSETDEGQRISAAKIKYLTGRDELTGRRSYDKYNTRFQPTHKLILMTNTLPTAPPNDKAYWMRVHTIPFDISFVNRDPQEAYERRAVLDLYQRLLAEAYGILAWLVEGCLLWQRDGLKPPLSVLEASEKYRRDEDMIADFIDECCFREPGAKEKSAVLYARFVDWYHDNIGQREPTGTWFGKQLVQKFERTKSEGCNVYHGIALSALQG